VETTADVAIIGAGVVGASTALELSRRGRRVVVLDKGGGAGHGSTSASSAIVRFNYSTWDGVAASWESKSRWESWRDHLGHGDPAGLARFHRCGLVMLDVETAPRGKSIRLFERAGIPYEEWDAATLRKRLPGIDTGSYYPPKPVTSEGFFSESSHELGGLFTPDAGYVDDPRLAAANLAAAAAQAGATFAYHQQVIGLTRTGETWRIELADDSTVDAPVVVNAAGPWSGAVNRLCDADRDFTVAVRPMRQEVHHVAAPPELSNAAEMPVIADLDLGTYIRPESGQNLLIGGTEPECDPLEWIDDPDASDPRPSLARFEAQVTRAARRFPGLRVPNRPKGISGVYDVASDWTPVYDRTSLPGFYVAMGTSGNQFKNAPLVGALMATLIEGVESGHDHDSDPLTYNCSHTGHVINIGAFSRKRELNLASSGNVMG
jgi:glycine/D-amino acid oxidase-like deaminating enzyme